jgi:hypothetical protein
VTGDGTLLDVDPGDPVDDPGFIARRAILPAGNAWGGTPAQQAHMDGACDPAGCRHCAAAQALRSPQ